MKEALYEITKLEYYTYCKRFKDYRDCSSLINTSLLNESVRILKMLYSIHVGFLITGDEFTFQLLFFEFFNSLFKEFKYFGFDIQDDDILFQHIFFQQVR
ncbi:hypothetical protein ACFGWO_07805 [Pasteurella multocida]|uniref:hypothetical protein n=1 Tax=Pasteurella multocida TaxID=747 RepID=UPI0035F4804E